MELITSNQIAREWGISGRRVKILCTQGRVLGASKQDNIWLIPKGTKKPAARPAGRPKQAIS